MPEPLSFGLFLNGRWVEEGTRKEIRAPGDGRLVGAVYLATSSHAEGAVQAAVEAFHRTRRMPSHERRRILQFISDRLASQRDDLARILALEAGKPLKLARLEVDRAVFTFGVAAEEATRISGEFLPLDLQPAATGRWGIVRRFPLGPVLSITPFNFPLNLVAHKVAPAIAAGCTVNHKPPPQAPLCSHLLAQIVAESGWPAGALNVVPLANVEAERLVQDDRLKLLSFTGSAAVGWMLKQKAGKKRVLLELGGNAAVVVHADADLPVAAERCAVGGFTYAGQTCISVQRVFVQRSVYEKFLEEFVARVQKLKVGDVLDETTDVGPMITEDAAVRALEWIDEALDGGARILCGGHRRGAFVEPTVLTSTRPEQRVNCEEVFAPVVTVEPYDDFTDALRLVNDSRYGLQTGLFTRDAKLIFRAYEELEVGALIVGDSPTFRIDHMPYGGVKDSGLGREGVRSAIEEMTERKLLVLNLG